MQMKLALGKREAPKRRRTSAKQAKVAHRARPGHDERHPVHVTWRVVRGLPSLRQRKVAAAIGNTIRGNTHLQLARGASFRVIHFSIQPDHLHLIVEGGNKQRLTAGLRGLGVWIARRVNAVLGRSGQVLSDRYHAHVLATAIEVRHAIAYVLRNHEHHVRSRFIIDECSSGMWFDGWTGVRFQRLSTPSPVGPPNTWLAREGWRKIGLIDLRSSS